MWIFLIQTDILRGEKAVFIYIIYLTILHVVILGSLKQVKNIKAKMTNNKITKKNPTKLKPP